MINKESVRAGDKVKIEVDFSNTDRQIGVLTIEGTVWMDQVPYGDILKVGVYAIAADNVKVLEHDARQYTPTVKDIREAYIAGRVDSDIITRDEAEAEFDRWQQTHRVLYVGDQTIPELRKRIFDAYDNGGKTVDESEVLAACAALDYLAVDRDA